MRHEEITEGEINRGVDLSRSDQFAVAIYRQLT
jgi:hypothetical protein